MLLIHEFMYILYFSNGRFIILWLIIEFHNHRPRKENLCRFDNHRVQQNLHLIQKMEIPKSQNFTKFYEITNFRTFTKFYNFPKLNIFTKFEKFY